MSRPSKTTRKRPLNVSVRADLAEEAKAFGTNVSGVLERALEEEHRERRRKEWQREHKTDIEAWNDWVEENGIPLAEFRTW